MIHARKISESATVFESEKRPFMKPAGTVLKFSTVITGNEVGEYLQSVA